MIVGVAYCLGVCLMDYALAALAGIRLADDMARLVCRPKDIDYRIRGLGLCTLAVLLLYALGWIGLAESG